MESFVVRLWAPQPREPVGDELRGVVRRVATGDERVFVSDAELLAFLRAEVPDRSATPESRTP